LSARHNISDDNQRWYKDAVIYQLHVKTFFDSNEDGIGDFRGLIKKLDYFEDLGVTAIWLLPFYPSPLRDDGYDIADYMSINPDYGTVRDFRAFMKEAHRRGMKVITELVLNHTSDQHPWFQKARQAKKGSPARDFYVWSDTPDKYTDARIIFLDFEPSNWAWDPVAKSYYWHRFYSHQPDLNFDNPQVLKAMHHILDFWLEMGVDGLRLDAVPYLFEREGTNCENLRETHDVLRKLRTHIDSKYKNRMLLAEANQWPEDAAEYFGGGKECHMAFHFPVMPRIFMALQMEDRFPIVDILGQTPDIPVSCQWAMFLRNHDELTLEMVTDEERDYMYKVYARDPKARINLGIRRRLAPLVGNNRRRMELLNIMLFSLPGTPVIYYGDEIGMGDNYYLGDRNGVRTPMQWSSDRNAGFSRANPQKLYLPVIIDPEYHYEAMNVENQQANPSSLLWWMKRVIAMRKRFKAFGRGTIKFIASDNPKVLSFVREYNNEIILVVINLSRFSQVVELDLSEYAGFVPEELFGQSRFPVIRETPYVLTPGFYDYYWFSLKQDVDTISMSDFMTVVPELSVKGKWENVFTDKTKARIEKELLPEFISGCRWFGGKARKIQKVRISENIAVGNHIEVARLLFLEVSYADGPSEQYTLPVSFVSGEAAEKIIEERPHIIVARVRTESESGIIYDAIYNEDFQAYLLRMIERKRTAKGLHGEINALPGKLFKNIIGDRKHPLPSHVLRAEQSNTSFLYENTFFLKLYRKLEEGINPDVEIMRFLTEKTGFKGIPPFAGVIEYRKRGARPVTLGHLQGFVPNQGDCWTLTSDAVMQYYENVLSAKTEHKDIETPPLFCDTRSDDLPPEVSELIGSYYLEMVSLLGKRTAEMHEALASRPEDPDFAPEPFSMLYQRSIYQSMRTLTIKTMQLARENMKKMSGSVKDEISELLTSEQTVLDAFKKILKKKLSATKIRYHGDYHLGQVLFTGNDFIIIDFEGEPARPLSERKLKRSPVRDIAGMIRSFHYAAYSAILKRESVRTEDIPVLELWADLWYCYVSGTFLRSYLKEAGDAVFIPKERDELEIMLNAFLLQKAVYELGYELNNRPDWVVIPARGIRNILKSFE